MWKGLRGTFKEMGFYTLAVVVFMVGMHLFGVGSTEYSSLFFYGWVALSVLLCRRVGLRKPWWLDTLCWWIFSFALLWLSFDLFALLEPRSMQEMGPGATAFLAPIAILFFGIPINGVLNRNKHLPQRPKPV